MGQAHWPGPWARPMGPNMAAGTLALGQGPGRRAPWATAPPPSLGWACPMGLVLEACPLHPLHCVVALAPLFATNLAVTAFGSSFSFNYGKISYPFCGPPAPWNGKVLFLDLDACKL